MAIFGFVILSVLLLQASSKAAPSSDATKSLEEIKNIEDGPKLDNVPYGTTEDVKTIDENENNGRQKRYYDYVEFGFPPVFDSNFPFPSRFNYNKRDESQYTGVYGSEDSLLYILKSLQRILNDARRQQSPPKPTRVHIPTYIPIYYLPQAACDCTSNLPQEPINSNKDTNNKDINHSNDKQPLPPTVTPSSELPATVPGLPNRFPDLDDMLQNWGTVVDQNRPSDVGNDDDDNDGNRPISLEPVDIPVDIPVPPVEHGSAQAGAESQTTTTTARTVLGSEKAPSGEGNEIPSLCDAAIVSCCVRKTVTYSCFAQQGCPDPSFNGDPCEIKNFRQVLNRVHAYVRQRNG